MEPQLSRSQFVRWRFAIFAIFTISGLSITTWASRVPAIKMALDIQNYQIGLLLLGAGTASILGVSLAPILVARLGAKRGMLLAALTFAAGVALVGIGTDLVHSYSAVAIGLALFGLGNGVIDVMMNVEAAAIEKHGKRTILPLFHAFFSVGTFIGAGLGFLSEGWRLPVVTHTSVIALVIAAVALFSISSVPARAIAMDPAPVARRSLQQRLGQIFAVWREPRIYALGVIALGMAFAEGGASDWLALGIVDGHDGSPALGAAGLAIFAVFMTVARALGGPLVDRFGRVNILRTTSALTAVGILLFIVAPSLPLVLLGAALWGAGAALGFPIAVSAAADDPARAAVRVSAVSMIGYIAFLCGPPLLGVISDTIGLLNTLYILAALAVASGIAAAAARPLRAATAPPAQ